MSSTRPPETRPYRIAVYAVFITFTLLFVGLVIRSIALDLFGRPVPGRLETGRPSVRECTAEVEALFKLSARLSVSPAAASERTHVSREFEERIAALQSHCSDVQGDPDARAAILDAAERLDRLRLHLSRCGEEGAQERHAVEEAIVRLRQRKP